MSTLTIRLILLQSTSQTMKHIHRLVNYYKNWLIKTQPNIFNLWRFGLYQRPSSEEVCLLPLPLLATIVMRRGKKSVVRVAECVAALVPVHRTLSLFPNMYRFFDPSSIFVRFSVQNCSCWPTDHMVVVRCMVSHLTNLLSSFVLLQHVNQPTHRTWSHAWRVHYLLWQFSFWSERGSSFNIRPQTRFVLSANCL